MSTKKLHIVAFDVPYPPNYGGVIDIYYKIKALHELGLNIILHTFEYGRGRPSALTSICESVRYYPRNQYVKSVISKTPFIVKSRANNDLIRNLKSIEAPILFEGLHTTYPFIKHNFRDRKLLVRAHNIEHIYYDGLSKSEQRLDKKLFFKAESRKLENYEKILSKADHILSISPAEDVYFKKIFGNKTIYIPAFHKKTKVDCKKGSGSFALYHGDLRVADNLRSVNFLLDIFQSCEYPLKIASSFSNEDILQKIKNYDHIEFIRIHDQDQMDALLLDAHINVIPTFQKTGIKLKLIHSLFSGRFIVTTKEMVEDTGLEELCEVATTKKEFQEKVLKCINKEFTLKMIDIRKNKLDGFDNLENARKIVALLG